MTVMTTADLQGLQPLSELLGDPSLVTPTIIVGIDTSHAPVRIVVTTVSDELSFAPEPVQEVAFHSLSEFAHYWTQELWDYVDHIALPEDACDPLGIRAWLLAQRLPLQLYPWASYRAHMSAPEFQGLELGGPYLRAYALAAYASYRPRSAAIARDVWAKVFEAQDLLRELKHAVHRLVAALPEQQDWPLADVPF